MLTHTYLNSIGESIEKIRTFKRADFRLDMTEEKVTSVSRTRLEIIFIFESRYRYLAIIPSRISEDSPIDVKFCPGYMFETEEAEISLKSKLLESISSWLQRVESEIRNIPLQRELENQQRQIEDIMAQLSELPNDYFSQEEGELIKSRLEELEARLVKNIETNSENEKEAAKATSEIKKDISVLQQNIAAMGKKTWAGSLVVRTMEWMKNPTNRAVLKSGAEVAKDLLLEAGKHMPDGK